MFPHLAYCGSATANLHLPVQKPLSLCTTCSKRISEPACWPPVGTVRGSEVVSKSRVPHRQSSLLASPQGVTPHSVLCGFHPGVWPSCPWTASLRLTDLFYASGIPGHLGGTLPLLALSAPSHVISHSLRYIVCRAAVVKDCSLGGLNNRHLLLTVLEAGSLKSSAWQVWFLRRPLPSVLTPLGMCPPSGSSSSVRNPVLLV